MITLFKITFDLFFISYSFQLSCYLLYNIKYFIVCRIYKKNIYSKHKSKSKMNNKIFSFENQFSKKF